MMMMMMMMMTITMMITMMMVMMRMMMTEPTICRANFSEPPLDCSGANFRANPKVRWYCLKSRAGVAKEAFMD